MTTLPYVSIVGLTPLSQHIGCMFFMSCLQTCYTDVYAMHMVNYHDYSDYSHRLCNIVVNNTSGIE